MRLSVCARPCLSARWYAVCVSHFMPGFPAPFTKGWGKADDSSLCQCLLCHPFPRALYRPEQNETLTCLQHNLDLCADNPSRLALLKLQVDPQRVHSNMSYFCANHHGEQRDSKHACWKHRFKLYSSTFDWRSEWFPVTIPNIPLLFYFIYIFLDSGSWRENCRTYKSLTRSVLLLLNYRSCSSGSTVVENCT